MRHLTNVARCRNEHTQASYLLTFSLQMVGNLRRGHQTFHFNAERLADWREVRRHSNLSAVRAASSVRSDRIHATNLSKNFWRRRVLNKINVKPFLIVIERVAS